MRRLDKTVEVGCPKEGPDDAENHLRYYVGLPVDPDTLGRFLVANKDCSCGAPLRLLNATGFEITLTEVEPK